MLYLQYLAFLLIISVVCISLMAYWLCKIKGEQDEMREMLRMKDILAMKSEEERQEMINERSKIRVIRFEDDVVRLEEDVEAIIAHPDQTPSIFI